MFISKHEVRTLNVHESRLTEPTSVFLFCVGLASIELFIKFKLKPSASGGDVRESSRIWPMMYILPPGFIAAADVLHRKARVLWRENLE